MGYNEPVQAKIKFILQLLLYIISTKFKQNVFISFGDETHRSLDMHNLLIMLSLYALRPRDAQHILCDKPKGNGH
jgi:hypothetical protein